MNEIKKFFEGRRNILFGENILIYFIIWKKRTNGIIMREFVEKWEVLITVIISITSIFLATKAKR